MFFLIIGIKFFTWGEEQTPLPLQCGNCGMITRFNIRKGMRFITLFFVIPTIPISGVKTLLECPNCKARFEAPKTIT